MKCAKHPKYKAIKRPRANCEACWRMFIDATRDYVPPHLRLGVKAALSAISDPRCSQMDDD